MVTQQLSDKLQATRAELAAMMMVVVVVVVVGKLTATLSVKTFPVFYGTKFSLLYSKDLGTVPILRYLNNFTSS
jgi:hypothetical protein